MCQWGDSKTPKLERSNGYYGRLFSDADYWRSLGHSEITRAVLDSAQVNNGLAKNIILFVGDGMSIPTTTAARTYVAQQEKGDFDRPEAHRLVFEEFPNLAMSKV